MDTNIKATLITCIFTLILCISGAYGVLKMDDANLKSRIDRLEERQEEHICSINDAMTEHQLHLNEYQSQILRLMDAYSERTEYSMNRLDITMDKFANKVGCLSESIARLEERMKPIEAGRSKNGS